MKMVVTEMEFSNIRKLSSLKIRFTSTGGSLYKNTFIMMGNGTGKTTTITLIKGLLDGSAENWSKDEVRSYQPVNRDVTEGVFSISTRFDERVYKYFLKLDYLNGTAKISCTTALQGGHESTRRFPDSIKDLFTVEFVRRFVFDGEQAQKTLDNKSNEAEEAIKYLYRLDELDEISKTNQQILRQIQDAEGGAAGTGQSVSNLRTRKGKIDDAIKRLRARVECLIKEIEKKETERGQIAGQISEIDRKFEALNREKSGILEEQIRLHGEIDLLISKILTNVKSPYLLSSAICDRMTELGKSMTRLKLPKTISKDFFKELASEHTCICGRSIGEAEKNAILDNAERYLGSDQQSVLNSIKSSLMNGSYCSDLQDSFTALQQFDYDAQTAANNLLDVEARLTRAGGEEAIRLRQDITKLDEQIGALKGEKKAIESKDESDASLSEENNLHRAIKAAEELEHKIASATRTNEALRRKKIVEDLVEQIRTKATNRLKTEIIAKTNEKLKTVITDDIIQIDSIDQYIQLKGKNGASEGQTLSIAYCFLGTMFEDSELQFPFIIDSPAGKMDFMKRRAVAEILPTLFNQLIAFVTSAEVEQFADRFYSTECTQFVTAIAALEQEEVEVHLGKEFFDTYQREHREEE